MAIGATKLSWAMRARELYLPLLLLLLEVSLAVLLPEEERARQQELSDQTRSQWARKTSRRAAPMGAGAPVADPVAGREAREPSKVEEALELAVDRLRVLESLDGQLLQFVRRAEGAGRVGGDKAGQMEQELCLLPLNFSEAKQADASLRSCLADARLLRQVPPYMLNLHRRLTSESERLADAVLLMPYRSLVMRSFRQPPAGSRTSGARSLEGK